MAGLGGGWVPPDCLRRRAGCAVGCRAVPQFPRGCFWGRGSAWGVPMRGCDLCGAEGPVCAPRLGGGISGCWGMGRGGWLRTCDPPGRETPAVWGDPGVLTRARPWGPVGQLTWGVRRCRPWWELLCLSFPVGAGSMGLRGQPPTRLSIPASFHPSFRSSIPVAIRASHVRPSFCPTRPTSICLAAP